MIPATRDLVGRLQVHWQGQAEESRSPALRLRVERQLSRTDLRPPGLPAGAILVIRRLDARSGLPATGPVSNAWQGQVRDRIAEHYRQAIRPLGGRPAAGAGSVLFADEAELLACLTCDVLAGRAWTQWYWQRLWPGLPRAPGTALAAAWAERAAFLPAALAQVPDAQAQAAVGSLDRRQLSRVVHALHAAFQMPDLVLQPLPPGHTHATAGPDGPRQPVPIAPWLPWLPEPHGDPLAPQACYLLGLALALAEAPAYARSLAFARASAAWLAQALASTAAPQIHQPAAGSPVDPQASSLDRAEPDSPTPAPPAGPGVATSRQTSGRAAVGDDFAVRERSPAERQPAPPESLPATTAIAQGEAAPLPASHALPIDEPTAIPTRAAVEPGTEGVITGLGGLLYLINWLVRLDLPGGWSDPPLAEHVGGWALLEMFGRALLGETQVHYAGDPLWLALQALDGRPPGQAIGHALPPGHSFRLPPATLRRYGAGNSLWLAEARGGRLRLASFASGYLIVDVPLAGRLPEAAVAVEMAAYTAAGVPARWQFAEIAPSPPLDPATTSALSPALAWWLQRVRGLLHFLVARALAQDEALDSTLVSLLCLPGRLVVSRTHVDLFLSLEQISIAARRAGLDQDPGWVPDLGRIVQFHFI
jgi:hypothetical protein